MTRLYEAKPFLIAEIGSNWRTDSDCVESIAKAKAAGADACKFQAFSYEALFGLPLQKEGLDEAIDRRLGGELPIAWLPKLADKAKACGIEFMCSAFSPELVKAVDPFVEVHKIASSDLSYPQLLDMVAKTGKPILLSCGASATGDVTRALKHLGDAAKRTTLLYCNAAYPSRRHNLYLIDEMRNLFGRPVGFSDHSTDVIYAPLAAFRHHGATVIEKHFTAFPDLDSPDRPHSLTADEFKVMADYLKGKKIEFNPTSEEKDMFLRNNRRLIAIATITAGDTFKYDANFGAYRSLEDDTQGISPFEWEVLQGRRSAADIKQGKGIGPQDIAK